MNGMEKDHIHIWNFFYSYYSYWKQRTIYIYKCLENDAFCELGYKENTP